MAYKEKYALDITPQGDTVRESIKKNRDEILEVAKNIDLKSGGGATGLRNRVLTGKISNGQFSFLSGDSLGVIIDGTQTPLIVSFAEGFNEYGAIDYIISVTGKVSAWTLLPNKTQYLYIERSNAGAISYGSTTVKPVRQSTPPDTVLNSMYYNDIMDMMYAYNGSQWERKQRVLIAEVITDATSVKTIKYYQPPINSKNIADGAISSTKITNGGVKSVNIGEGEVKMINLADKSVTKAKLADDTLKHIDDADNAVRNDLTAHKDDANAHKPIFDGFVKSITYNNGTLNVTNGGNTVIPVNIITSNAEETNQSLGVSLSLLNSVLSKLYIKNTNDLANAINNQLFPSKIGVYRNLDNYDNWYIKFGRLFGGLMIQGGMREVGKHIDGRNNRDEAYPQQKFKYTFDGGCLWVGATIITGPQPSNMYGNASASIFVRDIQDDGFRYELRSYSNMLGETNKMQWIAIGSEHEN